MLHRLRSRSTHVEFQRTYVKHEEGAVPSPQKRNSELEVGILVLSVADNYALLFCYIAAAQIER